MTNLFQHYLQLVNSLSCAYRYTLAFYSHFYVSQWSLHLLQSVQYSVHVSSVHSTGTSLRSLFTLVQVIEGRFFEHIAHIFINSKLCSINVEGIILNLVRSTLVYPIVHPKEASSPSPQLLVVTAIFYVCVGTSCACFLCSSTYHSAVTQ